MDAKNKHLLHLNDEQQMGMMAYPLWHRRQRPFIIARIRKSGPAPCVVAWQVPLSPRKPTRRIFHKKHCQNVSQALHFMYLVVEISHGVLLLKSVEYSRAAGGLRLCYCAHRTIHLADILRVLRRFLFLPKPYVSSKLRHRRLCTPNTLVSIRNAAISCS